MYSGSGNLPHHIYCYVDSTLIRKGGRGFEPCVWFGLHSHPGRAWGCHVLLECGAVYRGLPPHAIAFKENPEPWTLREAQVWDCYGSRFSTIEYDFLGALPVKTKAGNTGRYLFTVVPLEDGYTEDPSQSKEFMFCELENGRLAIMPTNMLLFEDDSFVEAQWPANIALSNTKWRVR
jgi:hypothetical protein